MKRPGEAPTSRTLPVRPVVLVVAGLAVAGWFLFGPGDSGTYGPVRGAEPPEADPEQVHQFCSACHTYPPPDTFPRASWRHEVKQAYDFFRDSALHGSFPSMEGVVRYYEHRAPEALPLSAEAWASWPSPVAFEKVHHRLPGKPPAPAVSNVNLVHLFDKDRLDVVVCDARMGRVMAYRPSLPDDPWRTLGEVSHPAHAEAVDLDGDGVQDVLVADLGNFSPTDDRVGGVYWLKGNADRTFTRFPLLTDVGRVADVQAADFDGDGKLDLVVAVFGWRRTGEILLLHNETTDWSKPVFRRQVVDPRHGAIHVPVADLDGDGRPDFVALISQEHECVVAFLNRGGAFEKRTLYAAPHPGYGSSGIQLVDLNADGRLDVLCTNGDVLDSPASIKPYHGVQWFENKGGLRFEHHPLAALPGAHRAVAADVDGDGDLDVLAVSFLPPADVFPQRDQFLLDSVVFLEQTAPGVFVRHAIEKASCDHVTCAVGDLFGDGRPHLVTGNFCLTKANTLPSGITVWKNLGRANRPGRDGLNDHAGRKEARAVPLP